jgi:hypothetical protein
VPDPPLPIGDGPRGARGDAGGGAGVCPASPQQVGPIGEAILDSCMRGWDRG